MQKLSKGESKMVGVVLTLEQIKFIKQKGKISTVIRNLIEKEIERAKL